MTNMQQLYASHLENVKHNREMERLQSEQNETQRRQADEQARHNAKTEELTKYQTDSTAAATRYTADQRNEGTHYQADTSAKTTLEKTDLDNANKTLIARITDRRQSRQQQIEAKNNWLQYLAKLGANQAALQQAEAAAMNANTNAMLAEYDKILKQTQASQNKLNLERSAYEFFIDKQVSPIAKIVGKSAEYLSPAFKDVESGTSSIKNITQGAKNMADAVKALTAEKEKTSKQNSKK